MHVNKLRNNRGGTDTRIFFLYMQYTKKMPQQNVADRSPHPFMDFNVWGL